MNTDFLARTFTNYYEKKHGLLRLMNSENKVGKMSGDDSRYLEAHHIIALAKQGPDTVENVIALCSSDHREAHYGKKRIAMENEMLEIIKRGKPQQVENVIRVHPWLK
jgi:5-methylcytosine-specific restriction endonuclease McrA